MRRFPGRRSTGSGLGRQNPAEEVAGEAMEQQGGGYGG